MDQIDQSNINFENFQFCFNNSELLKNGEYKIWECTHPNPIGKNIVIINSADNYMHFLEFVAFGKKIIDNNYQIIPISKITATNAIYSGALIRSPNHIFYKAIDLNPMNIDHLYKSCTGFLDYSEDFMTLKFEETSIVYTIGIVIERRAGEGLNDKFKNFIFKSIFFIDRIYNFNFKIERENGNSSLCYQTLNENIFDKKYFFKNCSRPLIGNQFKLEGSNTDRYVRLCEIYIIGIVFNTKNYGLSIINFEFKFKNWYFYNNIIFFPERITWSDNILVNFTSLSGIAIERKPENIFTNSLIIFFHRIYRVFGFEIENFKYFPDNSIYFIENLNGTIKKHRIYHENGYNFTSTSSSKRIFIFNDFFIVKSLQLQIKQQLSFSNITLFALKNITHQGIY